MLIKFCIWRIDQHNNDISYKINNVLSSKYTCTCTRTIGNSKPARTSLYDGTEPVILHVLCHEEIEIKKNIYKKKIDMSING